MHNHKIILAARRGILHLSLKIERNNVELELHGTLNYMNMCNVRSRAYIAIELNRVDHFSIHSIE